MSDGYMSNKQIYDKNQQKINKQDDILDEIIQVAGDAKDEAREMNEIISDQDRMLNGLGNKTDKNINHMKKTNQKLDGILERSSSCCLYIVILCEVAALVTMLVVFS